MQYFWTFCLRAARRHSFTGGGWGGGTWDTHLAHKGDITTDKWPYPTYGNYVGPLHYMSHWTFILYGVPTRSYLLIIRFLLLTRNDPHLTISGDGKWGDPRNHIGDSAKAKINQWGAWYSTLPMPMALAIHILRCMACFTTKWIVIPYVPYLTLIGLV